MVKKILSFFAKVIREELAVELDEKISTLHQDLHELLEWQANHALDVADSLARINQRLARIEQLQSKEKEALKHVVPDCE